MAHSSRYVGGIHALDEEYPFTHRMIPKAIKEMKDEQNSYNIYWPSNYALVVMRVWNHIHLLNTMLFKWHYVNVAWSW